MSETHQRIEAYLRRCRELSMLCRENGWIDEETLHWEIKTLGPDFAVVAITFDEVTMKGGGCEARRLPCFGHLRLWFDGRGQVAGAEPL